ncbi:enoyl-CoA hydratase/isomerase family protein [Tepidiforma sp.]|uniref:enoyl-CoA hydratase/isomerase family protein n=1 Tax=Tepidiforma sp. TaxID=2682230 RepID=UPI002ADD812A|nr:enoyl-CoA hydratase/isomerase family protein [Tepidiforma sp.]
MEQPLHFESRGPIGILTLNRPERLNAINHEMLRALRGFFDARHRDFATRVIVITGAGRGFCAGLDLKAGGEQGPWQPGVGPVQELYTFQEDIADLMVKMRECPQPLIAAVNGPATGGGFSIALACDMRIGTEHARFACSYLNLGLGGADVGSSYFLPKIVGAAHAADLLYSGRLVDAREAREMGLMTRIVPPDDLLPAALAIAEGIVRKASPLGLRLTKQVLNETVNGIPLQTALKLENRNQALASQTADAREARQAWAEKREPRWQDA